MVIQQKGAFFLFWKAKPKKRMITSSRTRYKTPWWNIHTFSEREKGFRGFNILNSNLGSKFLSNWGPENMVLWCINQRRRYKVPHRSSSVSYKWHHFTAKNLSLSCEGRRNCRKLWVKSRAHDFNLLFKFVFLCPQLLFFITKFVLLSLYRTSLSTYAHLIIFFWVTNI